MSGSQPVDKRSTSGLLARRESRLVPEMLNSGPTPYCSCKTYSCEAGLEIAFHARHVRESPERIYRSTTSLQKHKQENYYVLVEFPTRTHNGRFASAVRRWAEGGSRRRLAEQGADISVALEANRPSGPPAQCKQMS